MHSGVVSSIILLTVLANWIIYVPNVHHFGRFYRSSNLWKSITETNCRRFPIKCFSGRVSSHFVYLSDSWKLPIYNRSVTPDISSSMFARGTRPTKDEFTKSETFQRELLPRLSFSTALSTNRGRSLLSFFYFTGNFLVKLHSFRFRVRRDGQRRNFLHVRIKFQSKRIPNRPYARWLIILVAQVFTDIRFDGLCIDGFFLCFAIPSKKFNSPRYSLEKWKFSIETWNVISSLTCWDSTCSINLKKKKNKCLLSTVT